jgi:2-phospho-L-lactate/phosphoenolpyruvate guanylyltransferase
MPSSPSFGAVVPVKPPSVAKSRLAGLGDGVRRALASAFAADTVESTLACELVAAVVVVTDDHALAGELASTGVHVIPDGASDDLNATLVQAAAELLRRHPGLGVVAVCADLPAMRSEDLAAVLGAAPEHTMGFVADADGVGTTVLTAPDLPSFRPAFGEGSRLEHLALGATEIRLDVPSLRRDVDTPEDLAEASRLGLGPRSSHVSAGLI